MCDVAERLERKGLAEGLAKCEGILFECVRDGKFDAGYGAEKLGIPEPEFVTRMEQAGYHIPNS